MVIMTGFFRGLLEADPSALTKSENIDAVATKFTTAIQCFGKTTPDVITGSKLMLEAIQNLKESVKNQANEDAVVKLNKYTDSLGNVIVLNAKMAKNLA